MVVGAGAVATLALAGCSSSTTAPPASPVSVALWVGNLGHTIDGYTAAQIASNTGAPPAVIITTPGQLITGMAFDASGNLWAVESFDAAVVEYIPDQLGVSGSPTPKVTLTADAAGSLNLPSALAFDAAGNLWVVNTNASTVVEFAATQLASSGSPTPAVTLGANAGSILAPQDLAFDHSGNLWVSNSVTVVAFSASQRAASGNPVPAITISRDAGLTLVEPYALAFDGGGDLWVANYSHNTVIEYTPSQLASSGSPTPAVVLTSNSMVITSNLQGLTFDGHGNLWASDNGTESVLQFPPSQLMATGTPTPAVTISGPPGPLSLVLAP
jgi:hypothetical protein